MRATAVPVEDEASICECDAAGSSVSERTHKLMLKSIGGEHSEQRACGSALAEI